MWKKIFETPKNNLIWKCIQKQQLFICFRDSNLVFVSRPYEKIVFAVDNRKRMFIHSTVPEMTVFLSVGT